MKRFNLVIGCTERDSINLVSDVYSHNQSKKVTSLKIKATLNEVFQFLKNIYILVAKPQPSSGSEKRGKVYVW